MPVDACPVHGTLVREPNRVLGDRKCRVTPRHESIREPEVTRGALPDEHTRRPRDIEVAAQVAVGPLNDHECEGACSRREGRLRALNGSEILLRGAAARHRDGA
jgi:hypothetical protein